MSKILKYHEFITEGISNVIKKYVDEIYDVFLAGELTIIEDDLILNDINLPLRQYVIYFIENEDITDNSYHGANNPNKSKIDNSNNLTNIQITINYPKNFNNIKIKEIIAHELSHVKEYYEYVKSVLRIKITTPNKKVLTQSWVTINGIRKNMSIYNKSNHNMDSIFDKFLYFVYLSLDNELNARVTQLYPYIKSLNSVDYNTILNNVMQHDIYALYTSLKSFNAKVFIKEMVNNIELPALLKLTNEFNNKIISSGVKSQVKLLNSLPITISTVDDVEQFYHTFEKIFHIRTDKHLSKIKDIIKEFINDQ